MIASSATPHKSKSLRPRPGPALEMIVHPLESTNFESTNFVYLQSPPSPIMPSSSPKPGICSLITSQYLFHPLNDTAAREKPTVIDIFAPKAIARDCSPSSSADSDSNSSHSSSRSSFDAFVATRSRVIRLYNLPFQAEAYLSALFLPQGVERCRIPMPISMWTVQESYSGLAPNSVFAVFRTHEEAATALSVASTALSATTALESDLEPYHKLRRFAFTTPMPSLSPHTTSFQPQLRVSSSHPNLQTSKNTCDRISMGNEEYTISSNPPNPRTSFRQGDWICSSPNCAAHNFGRNLTCIGCGCSRSNREPPSNHSPVSHHQQTFSRNNSSPRFASFPSHPIPLADTSAYPPFLQPTYQTHSQLKQSQTSRPQHNPSTFTTPSAPPPRSTHPLLTPSGRAFAIGGRVQNVSSDPLAPCVMYWPDNESFPEQGQIRPSGLAGVPQPPILNTGNKGPIAHQPGDWVCQKCNYLNWRRRKVCQTCLPYAEGNGDSISAAVQAERIALLTSVLAQQNQAQPGASQALTRGSRSHSMTPPQQRRSFVDASPAHMQAQSHAHVHRSQSHFDLGVQYNRIRDTTPIYQTPDNRQRQPSPLYSTGPDFNSLPIHSPAPLLPSFLQDIVQSPALSPTSTSSADLSFEEYEETHIIHGSLPRTPNNDDRATDLPHGNIWRLDGEESKSLSALALSNNRDLLGSAKKKSNDSLRLNQLTIS